MSLACNIIDGTYRYTRDIIWLNLASTRVAHIPSPPSLPGTLPPLSAWHSFLAAHPDKDYANYIRDGLAHGFRIGFNNLGTLLRSSQKNHKSVADNPQAVASFINTECAAGRVNGPFQINHMQGIHISPLGIIPKQHQPGKWRLIVDLSFPEGHSVNDGIAPTICSIKYASVDDAVNIIQALGRNTLMAKLDLKSAYRMVPVHPEDQWLLGMSWNNQLFVDTRLPFGLRSAPKIFSAVADGIAWAMYCQNIGDFLHYLDDFLFMGPPASEICGSHIKKAITICENLGFPVAPEKVDGPTTSITFLGIEVDSTHMELRLPTPKLIRLKGLITRWLNKRAATKRELQVLTGHLSHAATVVRPGRTFIRGLIEASKIPTRSNHWVRLNGECQADLAWWNLFLEEWNGTSMMPPPQHSVISTSDASGSWGCGATSENHWFQLQWPPRFTGSSHSIAVKEMVPVVISAAIWGHMWKGKHVLFRCDNECVVSVLKHFSAKEKHLAHLSRCLFFFAAFHKFTFSAEHIAGEDNTLADALSRNNLTLFLNLDPQAQPHPSSIPKALCKLLLEHPIEWTSPNWRKLFRNSILKASPAPPEGHMSQQ